MTPTTCPIWGTPARELPRIGDRREIVSPCAGGRYVIFGPVEAMLAHRPLDNHEKILLTDWLMSQRRDGEACPLITSWVLETVVGRGGGPAAASAGMPLAEELALTDRQIAAVEACILGQQLIARLAADGLDTGTAKTLLRTMPES